jgi:hypothetical protein
MTLPSDCAGLRRQVYTILIVVAGAITAGRILSANLVYEPYLHRDESDTQSNARLWPKKHPRPTPMFSSNDRSRWATIRALVDDGTYAIGQRTYSQAEPKGYKDSGIIFEDGWGSVDKVMDPETGKFYSSKPTLFPTLIAGEYWLLKNLFGWTFQTHLFTIVRVILLTVNLVPLIFYWVLLSRMVDRFGTTDWGRFFVVAAACFGTFLTTFAITLNNHTVAACTALFALYFAFRLPAAALRVGDCALAGFFAALTGAIELPAMAFLVGLFLLLAWRAPRQTLLGFIAPAVIVLGAGLLTNYLAIGRLTPAYAELGKKSAWYMYEGSHWLEKSGEDKRGIDYASKREGRPEYVFHFLLGHHGLFLLTPTLLLSMAGIIITLRRLRPEQIEAEAVERAKAEPVVEHPEAIVEPAKLPHTGNGVAAPPEKLPTHEDLDAVFLAGLTAYLTVVVVGFYLVFTDNYGGWTGGPRWLFWLTPFWLLAMLPAVDRLAARCGGRALALLLLAFSVAAASFPAWNPWRHPWLYQFLESQGLIPY